MKRSDALFRAPRLLLLAAFVVACGGDSGTGPDPDPDPGPDPADVNGFVAGLGTWSSFAPQEAASEAPLPDVPPDTVEEVVQEPDVQGVLQDVTYRCVETEYSLTDTPREIVMYEPNASIMWVGNLIQGDSYAYGVGGFEELSIRQRDTLRLSIDLLTGDNFAVVPNPSLTTVQSAVGALVQQAADAGHRSGSSIDYEEELTYSVEQAALKLGLSARYMGAKAKGDLSRSRSANERTLVAHFVQTMFTISIELPQSPADMFSEALTQAIWDQQVAAGNVGANNLPVYIAQITYGRTLTYSLTSTHSEDRMRAAISASYDGIAGGGGGYTEAELRETLDQQNIRVTAIGGEGHNVLALISSGDLKSYFRQDEPLSLTTARPLSYQLNYLGDNTVADVSETTEYTLRECAPKPASGGRFDFRPLQESAAPVATPYATLGGDLNGDGRGDLLWIHRTAATVEVAAGFGQGDGTFDIRPAVTHPASPSGGWSSYAPYLADFDGDGSDDLALNWVLNAPENTTYISFSNGDGTFQHAAPAIHPAPSWGDTWQTFVGDVDGDGDADLIWNSRQSSWHGTRIARSNGDGTLTFHAEDTYPGSGWDRYRARIGDVDGDGDADMIWNLPSSTSNRTYTGRSNGDGTLTLVGPVDISRNGFDPYSTFTGDINRDGRTDLIWMDMHTDRDPTPIHRSTGNADGTFSWTGSGTGVERVSTAPLATYIGDFNGDGGDDILWNETGVGVNHVWIGLSNVNAGFDFTPLDQEHPASAGNEDWTAFAGGVLVLDVTGDGRDDVVWNERSATNRIYVAVARPPGG